MADYIPIFLDWIDTTQELNAAEKGRLIDALVTYAQGGNWQELINGNERYVFPVFRGQLDRHMQRVGTLKANASKQKQTEAKASKVEQDEAKSSNTKQNRAKSSKTEQTGAKTYNNNNNNNNNDNYNDNENKNDNDNEGESTTRTRARFSPPTFEEVSEYCRERRNSVDPQRFIDFYASKGWKVGQTPMKDWKAAVRTWEQRSKSGDVGSGTNTRPNPAQQYAQREYTPEEANDVFADLSRYE